MAEKRQVIRRRALQINQNAKLPLYQFALTGSEVLELADISRISRDQAGDLFGYQRPEVRKHISNIVEYLNGEEILFPNSIILAFSSAVKFKQSRGPNVGDGLSTIGTLEIPLPVEGGNKPAWIVDGQQRATALAKCRQPEFPVPVNAFVADDVNIQREQFLRVNSSKPLPSNLITELLPEINTVLPPNLSTKQIPSHICNWLNNESKSPLKGMIKRASNSKAKGAVIRDTSIIKMLEESLTTASGCLFPYRNLSTGEVEFDSVAQILMAYWQAVANVFPKAWGLSPTKSRLMHGAGIRAMGRLMDIIMPNIALADLTRAVVEVEAELRKIEPICCWTSGRWEAMEGLAWNEVQNVPRHINHLSNTLIRAYTLARRMEAS